MTDPVPRVVDVLGAARRWIGEHRRGLAGSAVLVVVLAVAALAVRPWSTTTYDLEDSGVWVTRTQEGGQIGRVNSQIAAIDYVRSGVTSPGVLQDGRDVYLVTTDASSTTIAQLDATDAGRDPSATVELGAHAQVGAGGGVVAAMVDGTMSIVGRNRDLASPGPTVEVGDDGRLAVGPHGAVAGYSPSSGRIHLLGAGQTEPTTVEVPELDSSQADQVTFTLVGEQPVVLDGTGSGPRVLVPGRSPIELGPDAEGVVLQRPGPDRGRAVVATGGALWAIDLGDGDRDVIDDTPSGDPIPPAVDDDCTYGAWVADTIAVAVHCSGRDPVRREDPGSSTEWRFRTGGPATVLNDTAGGTVYLMVDGSLEEVSAWPTEDESPTTRTEFDPEPPNPRDNEEPVAVADVGGPDEEGVGARVGQVTYLPLLRNDHDPNGDILAIDPLLEGVPRDVEPLLEVVPDGRSVAIDLSSTLPEAVGPVRFRYRATDGEMRSEYVDVEVEVVAADSDGRAPEAVPLPPSAHDVTAGERASFEVLSAFWDYDGDPLFLEAVDNPRPQHRVSWSADGRISFSADQPEVVPLGLTVKDVTAKAVATGPELTLTVTVKGPEQPGVPVLRNDVVASVVRRSVTVDPLANDVDPTGRTLGLVAAEPELLRPAGSSGLGQVAVEGSRRLRFTPQVAGDYVLLYQVESDGGTQPLEATILIRVAADAAPPVVRPDVVVVEETKANEIDLLANDVDPGGGLVSVTDLSPLRLEGDEGTPLESLAELMSVSVQDDYRTLRVDLRSGAVAGTYATFAYVASNDTVPRPSTVTVVVAPFRENRPPDTRDASASVRAGGVATVPLAAFASDPDRDPLEVAVPVQPEVGDARPSGGSIRFFAPAGGGDQTVTVDVVVTEPAGNPQPAQLTISIVAPDAQGRPLAPDLEARVREGGTVTVALPTDRVDRATGAVGLDPNGDAVRLLGRSGTEDIDGKVTVDHGRQAFVFESEPGSGIGLQTYAYQVIDSSGEMSVDGTVRVLVTAVDANRPPVAMVDRASASPGAEIFVDPVANDTDLDGDALTLADRIGREGVTEPIVVETSEQCGAEVTDEDLVRITVEDDADPEARCTVDYGVVDTSDGATDDDALSLPQEGEIVVTVRPGFDGVRPLARDDYVIRSGPTASGPFVIDVRANDDDRDGDPAALRVALVGEGGAVTDTIDGVGLDPASGEVTVEPGDEPRVVRYRITDVDGLTADAVVRVPERDENAPPELVRPQPDVEVAAGGDEAVFELSGLLVRDPDGDDDQIAYTGTAAPVALDNGPLQRGLGQGLLVLEATANQSGTVRVPVRAEDEGGGVAVLEIEVTIASGENNAPQWGGNPCGEVEAGSPARRIPLNASDRDAGDNGSLAFAVEGPSTQEQVSVRIQGRSLVVEAAPGASVGRTARFALIVADPAGETAELSCTLQVVRSRQPPLKVTEAGASVDQGASVTVDVARYVVNAAGGLRIEGRPTVAARAGTASASGTRLTFNARGDAPSGEVVVAYRVSHDRKVQGSTKEQASGRIVIQIVGRPDAPTGVSARPLEEAGAVEVRWIPGAENGSPVTGFQVRGAGGGPRPCPSTPCRLTGLEANGNRYTFTVTATNAVGTSGSSAPSNPITLDQPPSAPEVTDAVAAGPADGTRRLVRFAWAPGPARGSAIVGYDPVVTGADSVTRRGATGLDAVTTGDGDVCLTVTARNGAGEASPPSEAVCVDDAYGLPFLGGPVSAEERAGAEGEVVVRADVERNGADTTWTATGCGQVQSAPSSQPSVTLSGCPDGTVAVSVSLRNRAGEVGPFGATATVDLRPLLEAGPPTLTAGERSYTVELPARSGGGQIAYWQLVGTQERLPPDRVVAAVPWKEVTVSLEACNSQDECTRIPSATVTPFARPAAPTVPTVVRSLDELGRPTGELEVTFAWGADPASTHEYEYLVSSDLTSDLAQAVAVDGEQTVVLSEASPDAGTVDVRILDVTDLSLSTVAIPADVAELPQTIPPEPPPGGGAPAPRATTVGPVPAQPRRSPAPR